MKGQPVVWTAVVTALVLTVTGTVSPAAAASGEKGGLERSTSEKLEDKRYIAAGDRAYVVGAADGGFPPMGWHIRGEMGGVWAHPIKLLDGYWFSLNGHWLPKADKFTTGTGYTRMEYPEVEGLKVERMAFAPTDQPVVLTGLTIENTGEKNRSVRFGMDLRSELMASYPWGWSEPKDAGEFNGKDEASLDADSGIVTFREPGKDWVAKAGFNLPPSSGKTGDDYWGPASDEEQEGHNEFGNGTGARLGWELELPADGSKTVWFAVAGSHTSEKEADQALRRSLKDPESLLKKKVAEYRRLLERTEVQLPDRKLKEAFDWGKLNMADLKITARDVQVRDVKEGKVYPDRPTATFPELTGIGAGFPDYPWLFGTDGAYTAYPLIASGQWDTAMEHLRSIRDVSRAINGDTGKVIHEMTMDGSVYFGTNEQAGNTNETAQFATAVDLVWRWTGEDAFMDDMYDFVKDGLRTVTSDLDSDGDSWPEGLGMVERPGMGSEKLDVTAYTWQALKALERMAESKGDGETARWAREKAGFMAGRFVSGWWMEEESLFADSLCNEGDGEGEEGSNVCMEEKEKLQQRHWINAVPMETGMAPDERAEQALERLESDTFTGPTGLFHTGKGGGPEGEGELKVWSLPNSVMAHAEANYGRLGEDQALKYMDLIASELDMEMPGALTEIAPSPDYDPFVDFRERAMFMQAWSSYGTQWPVIHHFLGVRPDAPAREVAVLPDIPDSWPGLSVRKLRVGKAEMAVSAEKSNGRYLTRVEEAPAGWKMTLGHVLPAGAEVKTVKLNGREADYVVNETSRGREVTVDTRTGRVQTLEIITK
ncbi:hypothetical protein C8P63_11449 [Melghirimyces profundicolus]|uniref:Glycogen debranching protein n=1 Tax=Melghirimyces profundicolus TaxID=1242148 RepID=A0A2T6BSF2_9BACL|nr:glycogen debranching protein [Melghirimyces profundicolus]PTX58867.1 hypothetical protein C8P63_11449 [Melghirimyces profundicolus]